MKKIFEKTLGAIVELDDAINLLKTDMTISDSSKVKDLQKILSLLDGASKLLVESITVFAKYEDLL